MANGERHLVCVVHVAQWKISFLAWHLQWINTFTEIHCGCSAISSIACHFLWHMPSQQLQWIQLQWEKLHVLSSNSIYFDATTVDTACSMPRDLKSHAACIRSKQKEWFAMTTCTAFVMTMYEYAKFYIQLRVCRFRAAHHFWCDQNKTVYKSFKWQTICTSTQ